MNGESLIPTRVAVLGIVAVGVVVAPSLVAGDASTSSGPEVDQHTPTPPDETPTYPEETPTPPEETPTPPEDLPTPPGDGAETPSGDRTPPADMTAGEVTVETMACIENCDGVRTDAIQPRAVFGQVGDAGTVHVRLVTTGREIDLASVGANPDTRFRLGLEVSPDEGTFDPQTLVVIGSDASFVSRSAGDPATVTVEFGLTSGAINRDVRARHPEEWPERNVTATMEATAVGIVNVAEVSGSEYEELNGVALATNAQVFDEPAYEPPGAGERPAIRLDIAAPHYRTDGETVNTGHFSAHLPASLLSAWNVSDPGALTAEAAGGGNITVSTVDDGVVVRLTGYHYSSNTVTVTTADTTGNATGAGTPSPATTGDGTGTATGVGTGAETTGGVGTGFTAVGTLLAIGTTLLAVRAQDAE